MLKQAQELYSGRPDIALDIEHMPKGMELSPDAPEDKPDFLTHMLKLQRERKGLPLEDPAGKAPDFQEFTDLVRRPSSEGTSLDQLPHALVSRLDRFRLYLFTSLLQAFTQGAHDQLLCAVLHLCLIKKQPKWLIPNSGPILLEPYLRRLESSNVFLRQQQRSEWTACVPPNHFAYRKQLSPQLCAITCRWLTWWFAHDHGKVFIIDWDREQCILQHHQKRYGLPLLHGPHSTSRATQVQEPTSPLGSTHQSTRDRVQRRPQRIRHHPRRHGSHVQHLQPRLLVNRRIITMQENQNVRNRTTEWHSGVCRWGSRNDAGPIPSSESRPQNDRNSPDAMRNPQRTTPKIRQRSLHPTRNTLPSASLICSHPAHLGHVHAICGRLCVLCHPNASGLGPITANTDQENSLQSALYPNPHTEQDALGKHGPHGLWSSPRIHPPTMPIHQRPLSRPQKQEHIHQRNKQNAHAVQQARHSSSSRLDNGATMDGPTRHFLPSPR